MNSLPERELMLLEVKATHCCRPAPRAIAAMLTAGECDALTLNWSQLSYQHTAAVRAILIHFLRAGDGSKNAVRVEESFTGSLAIGTPDDRKLQESCRFTRH